MFKSDLTNAVTILVCLASNVQCIYDMFVLYSYCYLQHVHCVSQTALSSCMLLLHVIRLYSEHQFTLRYLSF